MNYEAFFLSETCPQALKRVDRSQQGGLASFEQAFMSSMRDKLTAAGQSHVFEVNEDLV